MDRIELERRCDLADPDWRDTGRAMRQASGIEPHELTTSRPIDLRGVRWEGVDLQHLDLTGISLGHANLSRCLLDGAQMRDADCEHTTFSECLMTKTQFGSAVFDSAVFMDCALRGADFSASYIGDARFLMCSAAEAKYDRCGFAGATFDHVELHRSSFAWATVLGTVFRDCEMWDTDFTDADFGECVFSSAMHQARGLEMSTHVRPSLVDIRQIRDHPGAYPIAFMKGCGLDDETINFLTADTTQPIQFYSGFISYSTVDEAFADRLYRDLDSRGIRCWKWNEDAKTGRKLWGEIDRAIKLYDKLVLIATKDSLTSPAVNREISRALRLEDERIKKRAAGDRSVDPDVLFPIHLDGFVFDAWEHERKIDVTDKVMADGRGWDTDEVVYQRVLERVVKDLKKDYNGD